MYIYTYIDMFGKYIAVKGQSTLWIDISFKKRRISLSITPFLTHWPKTLVDVETHDNPIPLESYTMRQGKVWAVICHPGKPFIIINLKECDN